MRMFDRVDRHSGVPAYIQIMNSIKKEILLGRLKPGDKLPPVRDLRGVFGVNVNTVVKALERLRLEGILESKQGVGYFVVEGERIGPEAQRIIRECISRLREIGIDLMTLMLVMKEVWKDAERG